MPDKSNLHYADIELKDEILEYVRSQYKVDLTMYSESSVRRRLAKMLQHYDIVGFEDFKATFSQIENGKDEFLKHFTVNVTEMFRDPHCFKILQEEVFPQLAKKETIKIWSAGCSTGEEVLSLNILLHENGLLEKSTVLATDISTEAIEHAKSATYKIRHIKSYLKQYTMTGGKHGLEQYFTMERDEVIFKKFINQNTTFKVHNIISDELAESFDLILCRNLLIYFNANLQNTVLSDFYQKLHLNGYLALGNKESIIFYDGRGAFEEIADESRIFRKKR